MTGKEKLQAALNHKDGLIPIDFGSSPVTGMHVSIVSALREHYDLDRHPVRVMEPYQMLGEIEDDLKDVLGIDVDGIHPPKTLFGFTATGWKEWRTPWGQDVLVPKGFVISAMENGDILIHPEGDASVQASGRMPTNGYFFDSIIRQEPFDEDNLNFEDNLEEFGPVSEEDLAYFQFEAERLSSNSRGIMANFGGTGLGDIALIPAPMLKHPKGIRDITEWYISTVARQDYVHQIFSRQTEIALENLNRIHDRVKEIPDAVYLCGTDFGTQISSFCSMDTFRSLYLPYYRKMTDWIHRNTTWKIFKHSCGAVHDFMPLFIEAGFDIINPVQISAAGMDRESLKREFGDELVFWGGGVDTQRTMAFGNPNDVREEVLESCRIFSHSGGFVFNAVHNIQAKTPTENVVAMIDTVRKFNLECE
jgi:hypothetical protein